MGETVELKIANLLLAIEDFAMIRRFLFDADALDARATEIAAIVSAGMQIAGCHEPPVTEAVVESFPSFAAFPDATRQAFLGLPYLLIWDVRA